MPNPQGSTNPAQSQCQLLLSRRQETQSPLDHGWYTSRVCIGIQAERHDTGGYLSPNGYLLDRLMGEAIVFKDPAFGAIFSYEMKQRGMLVANNRILEAQFEVLFRDRPFGDRLFLQLAKVANGKAHEMAEHFSNMLYDWELWKELETNQVCVEFEQPLVEHLKKEL